MTNQTTAIKNGSVKLPKEIRKAWRGADVFISSFGDDIWIKKLSLPKLSFKEMMDDFQKAARKAKITKHDVAEAMKGVRQEMYG